MRRKYRRIALLLTLAMAAVSLTGCSFGTPSGEAKPDSDGVYVIKVAGSVTDDHPITQSLYKFKELAEQYSGGKIKVTVYPNGQLGSNREFYEQCQAGNVQMAEAGAVILANFTDKFKFMQLPFLFNSREACQNFLNSEKGEELNKAIGEETNLYPLVYFENGWQALTNSEKEVTKPEDLKGMKVRTQENDVLLKLYKDMGCNPTPMSFSELFTGLQQGTVDGQVNPALIAVTGSYYEVQDYITDVNAVYDLDCIAMNYEYYKTLPEEIREIVDRAANEAQEFNLRTSANKETESYKFLAEKGMKVTHLTDTQRAAFQQATEGVYAWFDNQMEDKKYKEYVQAIQTSNQKYLDGRLEAVTGKDK